MTIKQYIHVDVFKEVNVLSFNIPDHSIIYLRRYPVDSLQIYFASSLELQNELISHGFYVPKDPKGNIYMPLPIIYANFKGWLTSRQPITVERIIPPEWLGLSAKDLGWSEREIVAGRRERRAFDIPEEETYVNVGVSKNAIIFDLEVKQYHLERTSIRQVNPEKWSNWAMFYLNLEHLDDILETFCLHTFNLTQSSSSAIKEIQQGGKEVTYYVKVGTIDFGLCLGCFDQALLYLRKKAEEHCRHYPNIAFCKDIENVLNHLRLRIVFDKNTKTFAKVGVAKIQGKRAQIMVKLASEGPFINIRGVLKESVEGKARGKLIYCDHKLKRQFVVLKLTEFCNALAITRKYISLLPQK